RPLPGSARQPNHRRPRVRRVRAPAAARCRRAAAARRPRPVPARRAGDRRAGVTGLESDKNAIELRGGTKTFRLPHHQRDTVKEYFLHPFSRSTYEVQQALDDVSFSVSRGEFFGIIGANGSGKSTLLKIIAQIYRQDAGTVEVEGLLSPFIELGVGFNPE